MTDAQAHWRRVAALFDAVAELPAAERDALLARDCAGDDALRDDVRALLEADAGDCVLDLGAAAFDVEIPQGGETGATTGDASRGATDATGAGTPRGGGDGDGDTFRAIGASLGPWRLDRVLGRGGMGVVYAAHRDAGGAQQQAAVKRLRRRWQGLGEVRRFRQEQRILATLSHPNIPRLLDHGVDAEGRPWFALELVAGAPLVRHADRAALGLRARIALFREVCAAVQHAHEHFVVHRDLKPANILVDAGGRPRVLDFGVAKRIDDDGEATRTGMFAGFTPDYAAPEQVSGGAITAATDVYALGVLLYELLGGRRPYAIDPADLRATADTIATRPPARLDRAFDDRADAEAAARLRARATDLRGYRRFVRGDLSRIVQTALAKEPARRYSSVQALSTDLDRFLAGMPVSVTGDTPGYRLRKFAQRNAWSVAIAALATVALLATSANALRQADLAREEAIAATRMKDYLVEMIRALDLQNARSPEGARRALEGAAERLRTLRAGSRERYELLALLLQLHGDRGLVAPGVALAARELPATTAWAGDDSDPARLRALVAGLRLRKDSGDVSGARDTLLAALAGYPAQGDAAHGEAFSLLGETWGDQGRWLDSLAAHLRAVALLERAAPPGDPRLQVARVLAAGALTTQRRIVEARRMTERALADMGPGDSQAQAYVLTMAALRRAVSGDYASAQGLMDRSAAMVERLGHVRLRSYHAATRAANAYALGLLEQSLRDVASQLDGAGADGGAVSLGDRGWLLSLRGDALLAQGRADAAARAYAGAARDAEGSAADVRYARALQAVALAEAGHRDAAAAVLPARGDGPADASTAMALAAAARVAEAAGQPASAAEGYAVALRDLGAAAREPATVHAQLRERRDRIRLLGWRARALAEAGDPTAPARLREALAEGRAQLGDAHPEVRRLSAASAGAPSGHGRAGDVAAGRTFGRSAAAGTAATLPR